MNNRYNVMREVKLGNSDLTVMFITDYVENLTHYWITTCGIRFKGETEVYWGNTIKNPRDEQNCSKARQVAAERAFYQMVYSRYPNNEIASCDDKYLKRKWSQLSNALYRAGAW